MANPYKDAAGHWTTKENDGGPCKHSDKQHQTRISGGKYQMRLNPESDWEDVETKEEWEELRASSGDYDMDENVDDDFGDFDDETDKQEFISNLVEDGYFDEGEIKDVVFNDDGTIDITTDKDTQRYEYAGGRLYTHEESEEDEGYSDGNSLNQVLERFPEGHEGSFKKQGNELIYTYNDDRGANDKLGISLDEYGRFVTHDYSGDSEDAEFDDIESLVEKYPGIFKKNDKESLKKEFGLEDAERFAGGQPPEGNPNNYRIPTHKLNEISQNDPDFIRWAQDKYGLEFKKIGDHEGYEITGDRLDVFKKNYGLDEGVSQEEVNSYKPRYEPEDFEDARFYPSESTMDGPRWVGRYRSMTDAHGLKGWGDENVKHVGNYNGTDIFQLPDGYYSINPNITSMSFKTKEALENYLSNKDPEEHKYGGYYDEKGTLRTYRGKGEDGKEYDMEGPDAYKAARQRTAKEKQAQPPMTKEQRQAIREQINKMVASLDDARSLDEAWDIEEGIKELEDMLKKYKGNK